MSIELNRNFDIVFIGGGPVGLWTAVQTKLRNPDLQIVVLEKYSKYQRVQPLFIEKESLKTDLCSKELDQMIENLTSSPSLSTQSIEKELSFLAEKVGIVFRRNIHVTDLDAEISKFPNAKIIVGSDGAHSLVREKVTRKKGEECFRVYRTDLYIADLTYPEEAPALSTINTLALQVLTKSSVHEIHNTSTGMTTLRTFVPKDTYEKLRGKGKIAPVSLESDLVDPKLREIYLDFVRYKHGEAFDLSKALITTAAIGSYASRDVVLEEEGKTYCLVGDAAFGVPFFRSLNNGLIMGTELSRAIAAESREIKPKSIHDASFTRYAFRSYLLSTKEIIQANAKAAAIQTWNDFLTQTAVG